MNPQECFNSWEESVKEGVSIHHSYQDPIIVHTVKDYYDADEVACEEDWSNHKEASDFGDVEVSVENILSGTELTHYYEERVLDAFDVSGIGEFERRLNELENPSEFLSFLNNYAFDETKGRIIEWLAEQHLGTL